MEHYEAYLTCDQNVYHKTWGDSSPSTSREREESLIALLYCDRFNPAERCLLASAGSSREICLYDTRATVPMRKVTTEDHPHMSCIILLMCPL